MKYVLIILAKVVLYVFILTTIITFSTCTEEEDIQTLQFSDTTTNTFTNPYDAMVFAYYPLLQTYSFAYWVETSFVGGEYQENTPYSFPVYGITGMEDDLWNQYYQSIYFIEGIINYIDGSSISEDEKNSLKGEAYFIRGLTYFNLLRFFGKYYPYLDMNELSVPILSTGISGEYMTRASVQEVYDEIVSNLEDASNLLPEEWTGDMVGKPTKYAGMAVLAQVYIWFREFDNAEPLLEQIITNQDFQLLDKFSYNFDGEHENNNESIFELQYSWEGYAWYDKYYYNSAAQGITSFCLRFFKATDYAKNLFTGDPRYDYTICQAGDSIYLGGNSVYIPDSTNDYYGKIKKWQTRLYNPDNNALCGGSNLPLIRLSDIYLLYSEVQLYQGNKADAVEYINKVRKRAYSDYPDPSQFYITGDLSDQQLFDTLRVERFRELYGEGSWWFDVIRWGIGEQEFFDRGFYMGYSEAIKIPDIIIEQNPGIEQN